MNGRPQMVTARNKIGRLRNSARFPQVVSRSSDVGYSNANTGYLTRSISSARNERKSTTRKAMYEPGPRVRACRWQRYNAMQKVTIVIFLAGRMYAISTERNPVLDR